MARDVNDVVVVGFGAWSDVYGLPTLGFGSVLVQTGPGLTIASRVHQPGSIANIVHQPGSTAVSVYQLAAAAGAHVLVSKDCVVLKLRRRCAPAFRIMTPTEAVRWLDAADLSRDPAAGT